MTIEKSRQHLLHCKHSDQVSDTADVLVNNVTFDPAGFKFRPLVGQTVCNRVCYNADTVLLKGTHSPGTEAMTGHKPPLQRHTAAGLQQHTAVVCMCLAA
jgi:hypothetical protein